MINDELFSYPYFIHYKNSYKPQICYNKDKIENLTPFLAGCPRLIIVLKCFKLAIALA